MKNMLRYDLKRWLRGKEFKWCVAIALFLALGHFLTFCVWFVWYQNGGVISKVELEQLQEYSEEWNIYPACLYEGFIGGEAYTFWNQLYFYCLPILAALPFGMVYYQDESSGYSKYLRIQAGTMPYHLSRFIVSYIAGAVGVALPYLFSFAMNALYLPAVCPNEVALHTFISDAMFLSQWYFSKPLLYFGVYLLLIMVVGGLLSVFGSIISFVAKNHLVVLFAPFVLYIGLDYLLEEIGANQYSICRMINPMSADSKLNLNIGMVSALLAACFVVGCAVFLYEGTHRERIN